MNQSEPFFFPGGETGCLLIHGFSGMPGEMRGLGERLAAQGHTILGVRLAGHGMSPEELAKSRWRDWLASAEAGFDELRTRCAQVSVVGFSLGGALSMLLARRRSCERLVLLATPIWIQGDWRVNVLPLARLVMRWYYPLEQADFSSPFLRQRVHEYDPNLDLDDPKVQAHLRHAIKLPVSAIDEMRKVLARARRGLPQVQTPTLVMHGRVDDTSPPECATEIITRIGSTERELVWWEETGHQMLVIGPYRDAIYDRITTFVTHGFR